MCYAYHEDKTPAEAEEAIRREYNGSKFFEREENKTKGDQLPHESGDTHQHSHNCYHP